MYNCIFTPHCLDATCDKSCPKLAEVSYLLERNGILPDNPVFSSRQEDISATLKKLEYINDNLKVVRTENTIQAADLITYCAICQNWSGSGLHCVVYNLRYAKYIEELKKSWSTKVEPEILQYMKIWSETSKILVISNLDYINFKDFESQTLLNLIQYRSSNFRKTIIVSPPLPNIIGEGKFFSRLQYVLKEATKN